MKSQKGQAFILVLILLAVGALLIVPTLSFASSGLRSQRVTEDALTQLYATDSAIEDALWQLINQLMGTFDPNNPQPITYDFQSGGSNMQVTINIPTVPASDNYGTGDVHNLVVDVVPKWAETPPGGGSYTFNYILRFDTQTWNLTNFRFTLPSGLTYTDPSSYFQHSLKKVAGNYTELDSPGGQADLAYDAEVDLVLHRTKMKNGQWANQTLKNYVVVSEWPPPGGALPNTSYLVSTTAGGVQTLEWRPYFTTSTSGRRILIQTLTVTGTPNWGVSYLSPVVFEGGFGTITVPPPGTGAMGVAMYTILIQLGGVTYQVVVAYDYTTGSFKIISYQIVG